MNASVASLSDGFTWLSHELLLVALYSGGHVLFTDVLVLVINLSGRTELKLQWSF